VVGLDLSSTSESAVGTQLADWAHPLTKFKVDVLGRGEKFLVHSDTTTFARQQKEWGVAAQLQKQFYPDTQVD
jgi:hypothetical protein